MTKKEALTIWERGLYKPGIVKGELIAVTPGDIKKNMDSNGGDINLQWRQDFYTRGGFVKGVSLREVKI